MIYTIINQKGGVGKTTTASALGAGLARRGKVLLIDMDAQGNLTKELEKRGSEPTVLDMLAGKSSASQAIIRMDDTKALIPSSPFLAAADVSITDIGKEFRLREALEAVKNDYDYIVIDTPPAAGILTVNALTAADAAIIPAEAEIKSIEGVALIVQTIDAVRKYCNPNLTISGILVTRFNGRARIAKDMLEMLQDTAEHIGTKVFGTKIRECTALKEAAALRTDIFAYAPKSNGAADYGGLIDELLPRTAAKRTSRKRTPKKKTSDNQTYK